MNNRPSKSKVEKLVDKLKVKDFKLNSLLLITQAINGNKPVSELLERYKYILKEQLSISKLMLFINNPVWKCLLQYGNNNHVVDINVERDLIKLSEITVLEYSGKESLNSFDIVIPVFHKHMPLAYLLIGDLNEDAIKISPAIKHMPFIQTITNIIVVAIENKRLAKDFIREERINKELEVASQMQQMLFPSDLPSNNKVDIDALYRPHHQGGGDYYDFIQLSEHEFAFCMADVSGKGVSAAILMSNFQANLRAIVTHSKRPLENIVKDLNDKVMQSAKGEKFITFFIAKYNSVTQILTSINAGHNPPVLTNGKNEVRLSKGCIGLGMFDEIPTIETEEIKLEGITTIVCYTDGLVELENDANDSFGIYNLLKLVHNNYEVKMKTLNKLIFEELEVFKQNQTYFDDIALLSCRIYNN